MDLAAVIISVIALVLGMLALPTVFQMYGGRPRLRFEFARTDVEGATLLRFQIWNQPIENKLLRFLRVTREPTEISAHFSVETYGGELVHPLIRPNIATLREQGEQVTLHLHFAPAIIPIARITDESAYLVRPNDALEPLPLGSYVIKIQITTSHQMTARAERVLIIAANRDGCYWRKVL